MTPEEARGIVTDAQCLAMAITAGVTPQLAVALLILQHLKKGYPYDVRRG